MDNHPVPPAKRQLAAQTLFVSQLMDTHTHTLDGSSKGQTYLIMFFVAPTDYGRPEFLRP